MCSTMKGVKYIIFLTIKFFTNTEFTSYQHSVVGKRWPANSSFDRMVRTQTISHTINPIIW